MENDEKLVLSDYIVKCNYIQLSEACDYNKVKGILESHGIDTIKGFMNLENEYYYNCAYDYIDWEYNSSLSEEDKDILEHNEIHILSNEFTDYFRNSSVREDFDKVYYEFIQDRIELKLEKGCMVKIHTILKIK